MNKEHSKQEQALAKKYATEWTFLCAQQPFTLAVKNGHWEGAENLAEEYIFHRTK